MKEKDVILQKMHSAESHYKSQVSKLEADLEDQRAKNNVSLVHLNVVNSFACCGFVTNFLLFFSLLHFLKELRSKNWKTVEALKSVEQSYEKLLKSNQNKSVSTLHL